MLKQAFRRHWLRDLNFSVLIKWLGQTLPTNKLELLKKIIDSAVDMISFKSLLSLCREHFCPLQAKEDYDPLSRNSVICYII